MMRHYDRSAGVAVTEWRNALQAAHPSQFLSLLYVANEVLQNSRRNRGSKFLEAMSPSLGQSLAFICSKDRSLTEKVRRTVKIWGDRQVYSVRYVNDLLAGLEPYREGGAAPPPPVTLEGATFSPTEDESKNKEATSASSPGHQDSDDDDIMAILDSHDKGNESDDEEMDDDEDDDDKMFSQNTGGLKLEVDINIETSLAQSKKFPPSPRPAAAKRRRSSTASTGVQGQHRRRKSALGLSNLLEVWNRLSTLQQNFYLSQLTLEKIDTTIAKTGASELENLVGDELQQSFRQNQRFQEQIMTERKNLHTIAQERHSLEQECLRYLPWLEKALKQDEDDIVFCDNLKQNLVKFRQIHVNVREARDQRRAEEQRRQQEQEELEKKRREEEESEKFRRAALAKETEAKPGMVWNPVTREYQTLNTDESWRD